MAVSATLLRETAAILRDFQARIEKLGPETLRLRGESFGAWARKRYRLAVVLVQLEAAAEPPAGVASGAVLDDLADDAITTLREQLAQLHQQHPESCEGEACPCRRPGNP